MGAIWQGPRPGDIFLTRTDGFWGSALSTAQALVALSPSLYTHAGIYLGNNEVLGALAKGATISPLSSITDGRPLAWMPVPYWASSRRDGIVATARSFVGRPYGFEDYLWIGLQRLGIRPAWLRAKVASDETLICSALADRIWMLNDINLFNDGRLLGAVTPGELSHVGWTYHSDTGPWDGLLDSEPIEGIESEA